LSFPFVDVIAPQSVIVVGHQSRRLIDSGGARFIPPSYDD